MIELTDEQLELKRQIQYFYHHYGQGKPYFYYSGAAGTGKTTVIKSVIDELGLKPNEVMACAYTGKAVLVLMRHKLNANTIHSFIYYPKFESTEEIVVDDFGSPKKIKKKKMTFALKPQIPKDIKLIFIDERGMVNDKMLEDILSFGIPVVMAGDHNQLPPVFGIASDLDNPDFLLTKVMRQSEGDPIIYLSQCILKNIQFDYGIYGSSRVVPSVSIDNRIITDYDIILCAKNKTREELNSRIREEVLHYTSNKPMVGEKMICRKNNWGECLNGIYLTNGLVGYVEDVNYCSLYRDVLYMDFRPDFMEESFDQLSVDYKFLNASWQEKKNFGFGDLERFEYAYALTTHLSQGSEYSRVLYMDEKFHDPQTLKRLRYTAITRAMDSITYVKLPEEKKYYQNYNYNGFNYTLPLSS